MVLFVLRPCQRSWVESSWNQRTQTQLFHRLAQEANSRFFGPAPDLSLYYPLRFPPVQELDRRQGMFAGERTGRSLVARRTPLRLSRIAEFASAYLSDSA